MVPTATFKLENMLKTGRSLAKLLQRHPEYVHVPYMYIQFCLNESCPFKGGTKVCIHMQVNMLKSFLNYFNKGFIKTCLPIPPKKLWSGLTQELKGLSENFDIFITVHIFICSVSSNYGISLSNASMQHLFSYEIQKCTKIYIMI